MKTWDALGAVRSYCEEILARFKRVEAQVDAYRGDALTLNAFCEQHGRTPSMMVSQCDILVKHLKQLLVSHENLYKMAFGEASDPRDDIIRRDALAVLIAWDLHTGT